MFSKVSVPYAVDLLHYSCMRFRNLVTSTLAFATALYKQGRCRNACYCMFHSIYWCFTPNVYNVCEPLKGCTDESREEDYKEARSLINPFSRIKDKTSSATPQDNSYPRPPAP